MRNQAHKPPQGFCDHERGSLALEHALVIAAVAGVALIALPAFYKEMTGYLEHYFSPVAIIDGSNNNDEE